jgi:hypothetical protein
MEEFKINIYELLDIEVSKILSVSVGDYINKIENTTNKRQELIIFALLSEDEILINKAKRIFKMI